MATWQDPDVHLFRAWRAAEHQTVSAAGLAYTAGLSQEPLAAGSSHLIDNIAAKVMARVEGLRSAGYAITGPTGDNEDYRLVSAPGRLIADDLRAALPADTTVGREILVFEETDSTNDLAAHAGRDGVAEGIVFFAESQRAGRGRLGRRWMSPPGRNLLLSVLLRPSAVPAERWPELTFCAALAVAETAEHFTRQAALLKWPNDVLLAGRKVAGILLETHRAPGPGFVVVGVGLNVLQRSEDFPPELRERAGSLAMLLLASSPPERREVAGFLLARLDAHYGQWQQDFTPINEACARRRAVLVP